MGVPDKSRRADMCIWFVNASMEVKRACDEIQAEKDRFDHAWKVCVTCFHSPCVTSQRKRDDMLLAEPRL